MSGFTLAEPDNNWDTPTFWRDKDGILYVEFDQNLFQNMQMYFSRKGIDILAGITHAFSLTGFYQYDRSQVANFSLMGQLRFHRSGNNNYPYPFWLFRFTSAKSWQPTPSSFALYVIDRNEQIYKYYSEYLREYNRTNGNPGAGDDCGVMCSISGGNKNI